jgi:hypothetical protein
VQGKNIFDRFPAAPVMLAFKSRLAIIQGERGRPAIVTGIEGAVAKFENEAAWV